MMLTARNEVPSAVENSTQTNRETELLIQQKEELKKLRAEIRRLEKIRDELKRGG